MSRGKHVLCEKPAARIYDEAVAMQQAQHESGKVLKRLTETDADVALAGQDGKTVYYTSAEVSPVDNHLFRVDIKSGKKTRLTRAEGWHNISMSAGTAYFIDSYSSLRVPRVINVVRNDGKIMKELLKAENPVKDYNFGEITMAR